jgi:acetyl-CoA synthetase
MNSGAQNMYHINNNKDLKQARINAKQNPSDFWSNIAQNFVWQKKWNNISSGNFSNLDIKWFDGANLNITENCLDRHLEKNGSKTALIFESNNPAIGPKHFTFKDLHREVCKASNMMKKQGVKKGDRVCLYMGMVPELMISLLACARIGAVHCVVFGGFSAQALKERINDCEAKLLITNDGSFRGEKIITLKAICDEALKDCKTIESVIVHRRVNCEVSIKENRDYWWDELIKNASATCDAELMDSEDPLFLLYTSGSTGRPKGILHTTAGYMVWAGYTFKNVFQVQQNDIYWCTADIGWITGHTYLTYGPLLNGNTTVMFEGVPTWPDAGRFWEIVDRLKVTHFYTAPTAIRALMVCDQSQLDNKDLSSLKVLGSVGEPINEEAWNWYHEKIGKNKCPIVDSWWQTETGGIMISALAGVTKDLACYATSPLPGVELVLVDEQNKEIVGNDVTGDLCINASWPGQARGIWKDPERFKETYFSKYPNRYFTGDGAYRNQDGLYRITGRVDDVINVSGHRMGTAEVEDAIDLMSEVVECAVTGFAHEIKGQGIFAFIIPKTKIENEQDFIKKVQLQVTQVIGPIARPDRILIVSDLPKTRSGKIMRRILKKIAQGQVSDFGDISTLLNPEALEKILVKKALL